MAYNSNPWNRLEYEGVPIYVRRDRPDWFVPNKAGDQILRNANVSHGLNIDGELAIKRFLDPLPDAEALEYPDEPRY